MSSETTPSRQPKIGFFVPCYNEEKNIVATFETIKTSVTQVNLSYEIVAIDDASTDQTTAVIENYKKQHPGMPIHLYRNETNRGLGYNYFKCAALSKAEYYIFVAGDHAEPLDALKNIFQKVGQADMIIPYFQNPSIRPLFRRIVSTLFTTAVNILNGHKLRYYNGPVLHRRENVVRYPGSCTGFGYSAELISFLLCENKTYVHVSIPIYVRTAGRTSIFRFENILSSLGSLVSILKMRLKSRKRTLEQDPTPFRDT